MGKDPIGFGGGDSNLYAYTYANQINLADPPGTDSVTEDPLIRQFFYDLWRSAQYGHDRRERSGWIAKDPASSAFGCKRWPWTAKDATENWWGPKPANTLALAHTHPDSKDSKPSLGGTARDPHDQFTARETARVPICGVSNPGLPQLCDCVFGSCPHHHPPVLHLHIPAQAVTSFVNGCMRASPK